MYREPKAAKRLHFDVIPRNVDDYQQFLEGFPRQDARQQLANPVWHIHAGHPPSADMPVTFQLLLTLVSSSNAENAATLWGFIGRYRPGVTPKTHPKLDAMVGYAINYYRDFVAPTKKFREPTPTERAALQDLRDALSQLPAESSAEEIQNVVYEIGRRDPFLDAVKKGKDGRPGVSLDWFNMLYQVLLGQEKGPRFGSFVAVYGLPNAVAMIDGALARSTEAKGASAEEPRPPQWLSATLADLADLDFEAPIIASKSADSNELSDLYRAATSTDGDSTATADTAAIRVFNMLSAVTGMMFKPQERNEPFGPMVVFADGRRSPIPSDFRGSHIDTLANIAERAKHPALRARLADTCWLLDRKRGQLGVIACAAYVEIVKKVDQGDLKFRFDEDRGALKHDARDLLRRALQIGRAIGWDKPETIAARDMISELRVKAVQKMLPIPTLWFSELDLEFGVSDTPSWN
jgi:lysyl-tRNA synthetase class 1